MSDERPITAEQALLAVRAAGLDPDKSLTEQLDDGPYDALERKLQALTERVETLTAELGAQHAEPADPERTFAETYRDTLNRSRTSRWLGEEESDV